MSGALIEHPILILFLVLAIGYGIGRIRIGGFRPGIAAVLFVGLAFGAINPGLRIPKEIIYFGLVFFIYAIGLASGPGFFSTIQKNGFRDVLFITFILTVTALCALGLHFGFQLDPEQTAGLYAGATTNTPALAGLIDLISNKQTLTAAQQEITTESAVSSYSLSYPVAIAGTILAISVMRRAFKVNFKKEENALAATYPIKSNLVNTSIIVENAELRGKTIRDLKHDHNLNVIFGRIYREGQQSLTNYDTRFQPGDRTVIVGSEEEVKRAVEILGRRMEEDLPIEKSDYISKRIFVSNPDVAGQTLSALNLPEKFSAVVTRVRRGDLDLLANQDTVLEQGDIIQFIARKADLDRLSKFFGDSYDALSSINLFSFGLGLALGLLLGLIRFELPGGISFQLGYAGGAILVALILGALRRTGPIVWTLPYSANLTFRQLGLAILLAGIGINSGGTFLDTVGDKTGILILLAGFALSFLSAVLAFFIGIRILKMPYSIISGMVAHQPAILDYSMSQCGNKLPTIGFTVMLPIALIIKILYVQLLFLLLQ